MKCLDTLPLICSKSWIAVLNLAAAVLRLRDTNARWACLAFSLHRKSGEKLSVPAKTWHTSRRIGRERT